MEDGGGGGLSLGTSSVSNNGGFVHVRGEKARKVRAHAFCGKGILSVKTSEGLGSLLASRTACVSCVPRVSVTLVVYARLPNIEESLARICPVHFARSSLFFLVLLLLSLLPDRCIQLAGLPIKPACCVRPSIRERL